MWLRIIYNVFGGFLIYFSSWVTEEMSDAKSKHRSYKVFGVSAIIYIVLGIGLDKQAIVAEQANRKMLEAQTSTINALTGDLVAVRGDLETVKKQNSAMLNFAEKNLTPEQAKELFQASAKAVLDASSTRSLRQKEHDLAQLLRAIQVNHQSAIQAIDDRCNQEGRNRSPSCGVTQIHDESVEYERRFLHDQLPQVISLRNAMLARLPDEPPPDAATARLLDGSVVSPSELANYLDALSLKLP